MNGKIVITISAFTALVLLFFIACSAVDLPVIQPRLENAMVYPGNGIWSQTFDYTVNCIFSKKINITLEVYNLSLHDWRSVGDKTYNNTGKRQMLNWSSKICSCKCEGTSSYRFKYNETVLETRSGPRILFILDEPPTMFKNATVVPSVGEYNTFFNYSVELVNVTDVERSNVKLVVLNPHTLEEKIFENAASENSRMKWSVKPFMDDPECKGIAEYYFKYDGKRWPEIVPHYGPVINVTGPTPSPTVTPSPYYRSSHRSSPRVSKPDPEEIKKMVKDILEEEQVEEWKRQISRSDKPLNMPNVTCNVTPEVGRWFKPFKYNVTIEHPDRANMSLGLFVYKPGSDTWGLVKYKPYRSNVLILKNTTKFYNDKNVAYIEWENIGIFDVNDVNKNSSDYQYFIWYYDGYNEDEVYFTGPENVTENHEPNVNGSVTPEIGTFINPFKYKAYINDPDGDDEVYISLYAKDPSNKMVPIGEKTVIIKGGKGYITWTVPSDEYPEDIFTAENLGNKSFNSSFYFEYSDEGMEILGISKKTSDNITGPYVKPANVTFINASVRPETGKYSDKFTYKAEFYSSENNTIHATLRVYDPSNPLEWEPFDKNETGTGTIYITWSEVSPDVFGPDDFNKTGNYSIVWRDEILYTKEKAEGPWSEPRINEGIPMVWRGKPLTPLFFALIIVIPSLFIVPKWSERIRLKRR